MARLLSIVSLFAETIGRHQPVFGRLVSAAPPKSTEDSIVHRSLLARVVNIRGKILTSSLALSLSLFHFSLSSFLIHSTNSFSLLYFFFFISLNRVFNSCSFSIRAYDHAIIARISARLIRFIKL